MFCLYSSCPGGTTLADYYVLRLVVRVSVWMCVVRVCACENLRMHMTERSIRVWSVQVWLFDRVDCAKDNCEPPTWRFIGQSLYILLLVPINDYYYYYLKNYHQPIDYYIWKFIVWLDICTWMLFSFPLRLECFTPARRWFCFCFCSSWRKTLHVDSVWQAAWLLWIIPLYLKFLIPSSGTSIFKGTSCAVGVMFQRFSSLPLISYSLFNDKCVDFYS